MHWPDRIMHPKPESDVKALCAKFCIRTLKLMAAVALRSWLFWMGEKPERYVIHGRDSKSSRKGCGQPPYWSGSSPPFGASFPADSSALVRIQLSSSLRPCRSVGGAGEGTERALLAGGAGTGLDGGALGSYRRPRHHISSSLGLVGRGSYTERSIVRPTRSRSFMAELVGFRLSVLLRGSKQVV